MTTDELVDSGTVADAAISGIEDLLDKYSVTPTSEAFEDLWTLLYDAVQDIEVKRIK
jgi:hypothetical protein